MSQGTFCRVNTRPTLGIRWVVDQQILDVNYQIVRESGCRQSKLAYVANLKAPCALGNQGSSSKQSSSNEIYVAFRESPQRTESEVVRFNSPQ